MEDRDSIRGGTPRRLVAQSPPSILIVERDPDQRAFLRLCLQRWYQIAVVSGAPEAVQHLEHCPPQGLIVGQVTAQGKETLTSTLQEAGDPPVLKLWVRRPPAGWVDESLRHPFMRVDLLRAVDRLVHTGSEAAEPNAPEARLSNVEGTVEKEV